MNGPPVYNREVGAMEAVKFTAVAIAGEINLDRISEHFGSNRKYKWEEPLVLEEKHLRGIIGEAAGKKAYVFYFGAVVFVNHACREIMDVVNHLKRIDRNLNTLIPFPYTEE